MPEIEPLAIGVCSWSLQVTSIPELRMFLDRLGVNVVQLACGDPHHASWAEGDAMPKAALAAGFEITGTMLGFPGEDYTTPQSIERTGGFGNPATRAERLETYKWGLARTVELGVTDILLHAGFLPQPDSPERKPFLDTLHTVGELAASAGITVAFETGQERAALLFDTLTELNSPHLKVNFDPANMLLYDMDEPLEAVRKLAPFIRSVHVKDANRPAAPGTWGTEVPLGTGQTNTAEFVRTLRQVGYTGPLCIEREVGTQAERYADIAHGVALLKRTLGR